MPLARVLEPEVMDTPQEAADYDAMDHREVNQRFVTDLLAALSSSEFKAQGSKLALDPTLNFEPGTLNLDVLDLGAGTAQIPIELCRRYPDCRVMAADAAVNMLELARYNLEVENLTHRIELAHVDAKRLPFRDGMFDVVMSNSIIHHIPEPIHVLREAVRATAPGGFLFFRDLLRPQTDDELHRLVATYTAGANDHQQRMFAESLHAALSLGEIRELIASLGLPSEGVQQTSDRHWTWVAIK
jgi:ubiquinone/menaquinone biosynthesis C-methylase UbiE